MAEEEGEETVEEHHAPESASGGLMNRILRKKGEGAEEQPPEQASEGVAHVPATVLTVEYLDESEGVDATLRDMNERLDNLEEQVSTMAHTQAQLIGAINQQAKDIGRCVEAIGRRIDKLYRKVTGGKPPERPKPSAAGADTTGASGAEMEQQSAGVSTEVEDSPEHQNAWRVARVLAADLESYHEESVKEGVLYGTFYKLLREPIEKARKTYEERVPQEIVENYDYFSRALDELIVRKRRELEEEGAL